MTKHYLSKKKYSVGKISKLEHVETSGDHSKVKVSMAVADALVPVLKGEALDKFLFLDDGFKGKDFKMLDLLKENSASLSKTEVAKEMLAFFQYFPQGLSSPDSYEKDLR